MPNAPAETLGENDTLWRYIDLAKYVALVRSSSLYFTRLTEFEDPYEGMLTETSRDMLREVLERLPMALALESERLGQGVPASVCGGAWAQTAKSISLQSSTSTEEKE